MFRRSLALLALTLSGPTSTLAFVFQWAPPSYQCYTQTLSWIGGVPPFKAIITPSLQKAFVYDIPDSAYNVESAQGSYDIQLQLFSGIQYVLWMSDATGVGTGGSTNIMTVQGYGESGCLSTAERNQTQMTWSVETFQRNIVQCKASFPMDWSQTVENGQAPFNMTVISLDQSFDPFDVDFGSNSSVDWQVNLKAGSEFTIMFNDARGYGTGGTGERYQVNSTAVGDTSCLDGGGNQTITPGVSHTRTSTVMSTSATSTSSSTVAPNNGDDGGLSDTAVYAVASVGAVIGVALSAAIGFCCFIIRRRRRNREQRQGQGATGGARREGDGGSGAGALGLGLGRFRRRGRNGEQRYGHPNEGVDLFDGDSSLHGSEFSPVGGGPARMGARTLSDNYSPMPYTPGGGGGGDQSPGGYIGGDYPLSATGTFTSAGVAGRGTGRHGDGEAWHELGEYPASNPFDDRTLSREDSLAALVDRKWPLPAPSHSATPTSASANGERNSPLDTGSHTETPLLRHFPAPGEASALSPAGQRKEDEMLAEFQRARDASREQDASDPAGLTAGSTWSGSGNSQNASAIMLPPPTGTFRVTNAGEGDPVVATPPPSATMPRAPTSAGTGQRRRRLVDPFDTVQPRFVRHADAGRVTREAEVIDLPPLYTDLDHRPNNQANDQESPAEGRAM